MRDYRLLLKDILAATEALESFVEGMELEEFTADDKTRTAVFGKFEIIGEAAKNVPEDVKRQYPTIPWKEMEGMRDRLIHAYFGIDYGLVWAAIKNRLPVVKKLITQILLESRCNGIEK